MRYWVLYGGDYVIGAAECPDVVEAVEHLISIGYVEVSKDVFDTIKVGTPASESPDDDGDDAIWAALDAAYQEGVDSV